MPLGPATDKALLMGWLPLLIAGGLAAGMLFQRMFWALFAASLVAACWLLMGVFALGTELGRWMLMLTPWFLVTALVAGFFLAAKERREAAQPPAPPTI